MDRATTLDAGGGTFETAAGTHAHPGRRHLRRRAGWPRPAPARMVADRRRQPHRRHHHRRRHACSSATAAPPARSPATSSNNGALVFDRANTLDVAGVDQRHRHGHPGRDRRHPAAPAPTPTPARRRSTSGALYVNGDQTAATGATTAASGATLGGVGTIGGDVTIADGATLAPGDVGAAPGTLAHRRQSRARRRARSSTTASAQANVPGGPLNDLTPSAATSTLDGTLNVTTTPGGAFDPGVYRVFNYGGTLTDNGLTIGTIPAPDFLVQTSVAQPGQPRQHHRPHAQLLGRRRRAEEQRRRQRRRRHLAELGRQRQLDRDHRARRTRPSPTAPSPSSPAPPAPSTVDDSLGDVTVSGMQFATDGYLVEGDPITLVGAPAAIVRVGDGTAAGAAMTATIAAELTGASQPRQDRPRHPRARRRQQLHRRHRDRRRRARDRRPTPTSARPPAALSFDGGTLRTTASFTTARATTLEAGGGTIETTAGTLTHDRRRRRRRAR